MKTPVLKILFAVLLPFNVSYKLLAQVAGCTDPQAINYNNAATVNDGSCTYNVTSYTPIIKVDPLNDTLRETSALQMAGGFLWTLNDRGNEAAVYRIDTLSNKILQTVYLGGATNIDWEELAFDGIHLYVGDVGNNLDGARTDLKIYKFPLAAIPSHITSPVVTIPAQAIEVINFSYADQPQPPVAVPLNTAKFDCEAMIVDAGKIHLFSKNWGVDSCSHYIINSTAVGTYSLWPVEKFAPGYLVTAADKPIGQDFIVLYGYQKSGTGNHFMQLMSGYKNGLFFNGNKRLLSLPNATVMGQGEGITFRDDSTGYISNEKFDFTFAGFSFSVAPKLRSFNIRSYVSSFLSQYIFTGNGNWSVSSNWKNSQPPPAVLTAGSSIYIDPVQNGECVLDINYQLGPKKKMDVAPGKKFRITGSLIVTE